MADYTLEVQPRTVVGKKVNRLRKAGLVPITVYGSKIDPLSLQVPYRKLEIALMNAGGTNLIDIVVEGGKTHSVLARDVQRDVVKGFILHADFLAVDLTVKIQADIPLNFINISPAAEAGATLITGANTITVEMLPSRLMNQVDVDLSRLVEIGDTITVGDLNLDEDITIINDPEEMVVSVRQTSAARSELLDAMAEDEADEQTGAEPEVIGRGAEDEEEDE